MIRLQDRIGELHVETDEERMYLREMHKERIRLNKDKEIRQSEIAMWEAKCNNIQLLKFGRMVDVEALEAGSDRSKEIEAEKTVKMVEDEGRSQIYRMEREFQNIQEKLAKVKILDFFCLLSSVFHLPISSLSLSSLTLSSA